MTQGHAKPSPNVTSGSSFPSSPANNDRHWLTTDETEYRYDTTAGEWIDVSGAGGDTADNTPACSVSGGYVTRTGTDGVDAALLYSPDVSNRVYLFESDEWTEKTIPDAGVSVTAEGLTASKDHFLYIYDNAGTLTLDLVESTGSNDPITQNGIYVKPAATDRLLVARCYSDSSGDITTYAEDASTQLICNIYNKRRICVYKTDSTVTPWTYNTETWRAANADSTNRVNFVTDGNDDVVGVVSATATNNSAYWFSVGIGLDSTTVNSATILGGGGLAGWVQQQAFYTGKPSAGHHALQWIEISETGGTTSWGSVVRSWMKAGIQAEVMA